ncbi:hypothetical protein HOT01_gp56 [Salmonella phage vB_SenS_PHB07]|uniref:Uncharacterized protein n=1 Tax=Salmonella phage vB_SenS_PHB07 TaxID=2136179 RepID=A0A2R3U9G7_9CAUD|nr:hypothetical protein HOT01_gp56 [Salmonella phage vB_SenS_PHB07]AVQ09806.1 hypothetical protein [Salmonella phage vB_SenS_PHB07]
MVASYGSGDCDIPNPVWFYGYRAALCSVEPLMLTAFNLPIR